MNLVFFLKIFSDVCYYLAFACFFGSTFGQESFLMPAAALLALCAALGRWIDRKKPGSFLRFFPMLLLGALAIDPPELAGCIVLIPPVGFVLYALWRRRFTPNYYQENDNFFLMLKIPVLPLVFAILLMEKARIERFSLPYLVAFLLSGVLLLRLLRHDEETMSRPQFRLMNLAAISGAVLAALVMFSPFFRRAVAKGLSLLLSGVVSLLFYLFKPLSPLINRLFERLQGLVNEKAMENQPIQQDYQVIDPPFEPHFPVPDTPPKDLSTLWAIFVILLFLALFAGAVLLFRKLLSERSFSLSELGAVRRFFVSDPEPRKERLSRFDRTPAQRVRYWYRRYLILIQSSGGRLSDRMNTRQQQQTADITLMGLQEGHARLRALYLPARYADRATEQDVKEAQSLYRAQKKDRGAAERREHETADIHVSLEALREMRPKKSEDVAHESFVDLARPGSPGQMRSARKSNKK